MHACYKSIVNLLDINKSTVFIENHCYRDASSIGKATTEASSLKEFSSLEDTKLYGI